MPQSAGSSFTHQSGSSHGRRYRTRAQTSHVDETLFGVRRKHSACDVQDRPVCSDLRATSRSALPRVGEKTETVHIITKDLIRNLKVPSKDPSGLSVILCPSDTKRIMERSRISTKEEREAARRVKLKEQEAAMDAVEELKIKMRQADLSRKKNKGLSDLEAEAQRRAQYLLERANAMRMEQEDEIKKLNTVILGAQCHAVRDAQILEKRVIQKEMQDEERRLDTVMEIDRIRALEAQEQIDRLHKQQMISGKTDILKQLEQRQEDRLLLGVMREQEGQQMLENLEKLQMEELEALQRKKEEQRQLQLEILKINEESLRIKEHKKEEEKMAELRALEYTRQKMEREAEYEAEQQRIKREKEKDVARLRALQERDRDYKAEQDELRARRIQEATEREWRRKELEQVRRKAEEEERLKAARLEQISHKERLLSIEARRERAEFDRVLRALEERITHDNEQESKQLQQAAQLGDSVRQQIREREARALEQRREALREGARLEEEARRRQARLDLIKEKKLRELKEAGLPDKYCSQVERKAFVLPALAH